MTTPDTPTDPQSPDDESKLVFEETVKVTETKRKMSLKGKVQSGSNKPKPLAGAEFDASSDLDEHLHGLWQKYGQPVMVGCGLLLLFYIGKSGWEYFASQKESGIQEEFSSATTPDRLQAFVAAHPDHPLSGLAELQIADQSYAAGNLTGAVVAYGKADSLLKTGPLDARAQLGLAMSQVQSGQTAEGESGLHRLSDDVHQFQAIRAEATYQLASLAASAGRADEVQKLAVQLLQIDPNSSWAQRAFGLQVARPAGTAASAAGQSAPAPSAPQILLKPGAP